MTPPSVWRVGLGVADAARRPARAVAGTGAAAAGFAWRSHAAAPVRRPVGAALAAAERRGALREPHVAAALERSVSDAFGRLVVRLAAEVLAGETLERVIAIAEERRAGIRVTDALLAGDGTERVVAHVVEQPAIDTLVARTLASEAFAQRFAALLDEPALGRLLAGVPASRFAGLATDQLLASDELRRIVGHVARSDDVRAALQSQSAGLASDVAGEVRDRTTTADDALERVARRLLRRRARTAPVTEIAEDGAGRA